jgi:hypothetical protein
MPLDKGWCLDFHADRIAVMRDAANLDRDALYCSTSHEWEAFILSLEDGEFDDVTG